MKDKIIGGIAVLALVLSFVGLVGGDNQSAPIVGGTTNFDSLSLSDDLTVTDDLVISGRSFVNTTSNTSTSTTAVGCIQTTATSTATAIRLTFGVTPHATTTSQGTNSNGLVAWQYGSCPI